MLPSYTGSLSGACSETHAQLKVRHRKRRNTSIVRYRKRRNTSIVRYQGKQTRTHL